MKVCPQCLSRFTDDMIYCLNDGVTLTDLDKFQPEKTLSFSETPTVDIKPPFTGNQNHQTNPNNVSNQNPKRGIHPMYVIGTVLAGVLLISSAGFGLFWLVKDKLKNFPTPTPKVSVTPTKRISTDTPKTEEPLAKPQLKIEEAGKIKGSFGKQYLKYMVTNTGDKPILNPIITVTIYQGDVKIKDLNGESELKILKPGQTVPIWVDLFFASSEKYSEAKVSMSDRTKTTNLPESQIYPNITVSDTKMDVSKGTSMYNNYRYTENWYNVSGVIQNDQYDTISLKIYVIFYDESSNIVGINDTSISGLKRGEKQKFETGAGEISSLFGKPKKFEIIITDNNIR